jgi:hypothetical protein
MKKTLPFFVTMLLVGSFMNAQTKVWDFGNDTATWPASSGIGTEPIVVDNLGLFPIPTNTNFGAITNNNLTFSDGFSATQRFQMNGGGYPSGEFSTMPTQRYLFFGVSGSCTVRVWFRTGSNGAQRTLHFTDGTNLLGEITTNADGNGDFPIFTGTYTGGTATLYLYGSLALNLYKVEVVGATVSTSLSIEGLEAAVGANAFAVGKEVFLSNIDVDTKVNVYAINGQLVTTMTAGQDMSFSLFQTGLYVINMTSDKGQKSVKVLIQ